MSEKQADALLVRTKTAGRLNDKAWPLVAPRDADGKLPTPPYAVVQFHDGTDTQERFTGAKATAHPRGVIHVVGSSYANCQKTVDELKSAFIDPVTKFPIPFVIAGETCRNLTWSVPVPVNVDNDLTPPLIYATVEIAWDADPI